MEEPYAKIARIFKALSDPKRVKILDMLSNGEMCACVLLEHFQVSQPTLSHDMKQLIDAGVVKSRRDGQRILYSLNLDMLRQLQERLIRMLQANSSLEETAGGPAAAESEPKPQENIDI